MICTRCLRDVVPGSLRTAGCAHCAGEFVHTSGYVHCDGLEPMRCVGWEITAGSVGGGQIPDNPATIAQPAPLPADGPDIADLVAADVAARKAEGIRRYGTPLRANNGRDALFDAYQEALDRAVYLRQAIEERGKPAPGPDEPSIELRYNEDDTLDEVVAKGAFVHLEQLDDNCWWLCVRLPDGREAMLTLYAKRAKVRANVTEEPRP